MRFNGRPYGQPWTTYCALARGGQIAFRARAPAQPQVGGLRRRRAPSFGPHRRMPKSACTP